MSRAEYNHDDSREYPAALWRGAVASSIRGLRGQALLRDLLAALDAMPVKELVANELEANGSFCTLGAVCHAKGIDTKDIDTEDYDHWRILSKRLNIARPLVREIEYENDEGDWERAYNGRAESSAHRWERMRAWVVEQIK